MAPQEDSREDQGEQKKKLLVFVDCFCLNKDKATHQHFSFLFLLLWQNVTANHRVNDAVFTEDGQQVLTGRFMYGPLDMVTLAGEKVNTLLTLAAHLLLLGIPGKSEFELLLFFFFLAHLAKGWSCFSETRFVLDTIAFERARLLSGFSHTFVAFSILNHRVPLCSTNNRKLRVYI